MHPVVVHALVILGSLVVVPALLSLIGYATGLLLPDDD